ncbi:MULTISPECIES: SDR family NAD(P)-dependent oxidoreductase [unclassified Parafrankia]|uniref:SDR family NAD(P)-dependent oxidoreductase n=1 Tax=unclassified Parafrankia TaxID=2994368 RepID=UPI000DA5949A|nr:MULTISPECIES: SDR family NAD(P)-dependent oxidoreductase [unclassified Parafrankia]TCJ33397.1 SDR family NAD(P)-dependent oxidoreductase [Parafrankia sp. BMG5.11]CAI7974231.1 SDR family NAD(P)-dependent oxidoreductase [Frankia sp. Hr75.2]SQD96479.1 Cis-2,3-dihydrobiphenyl-2,3-diol dehydrogenase [Parafrankia sp. Ea1.12]
MDKVWIITGANSGFGLAFARAAIEAGDVVVAAVRRPETMDALAAQFPDRLDVVPFDVTATTRAQAVVDDIVARHGHVDVLVNNAGRTHVGAAEETTEDELRSLFELHFFGVVALTRAVLPQMRQQRRGAIVQLSSMGGQMSFAGFSAYSATKFALEGWSEGLAHEVRPFGIDLLIVEPGAFRTGLFDPTRRTFSTDQGDYADTVGGTRAMVEGGDGDQAGDPAKLARLVVEVLGSGRVPLRLPVGADGVDAVLSHLDAVRADIDAWEKAARNTAFDPASDPASAPTP